MHVPPIPSAKARALFDAQLAEVRGTSAIRHAVRGEGLVMRGALHPDSRGAVPCSLPIERTGRVRVVLIATTVDEC